MMRELTGAAAYQPPMDGSRNPAAGKPPLREDLRPRIRTLLASQPGHKLVVLDDDPTGTQTVHDVPVLTVWDVETLRAEFALPGPCFYILTNSRSLPPDAAAALNREIARNLRGAADRVAAYQPPGVVGTSHGGSKAAAPFTLVSRSDSTLRGHFPLETDVLAEELGPFDATILIPYFEAGGRCTIHDVHYVAEGDKLVPAAETPFAKDAAFGYRSSNLRDWVEEKTGGRVRAAEVVSFSLEELRTASPGREATRAVAAKLLGLPRASVCVVNAAHPRDVEFFALAALTAERAGARFLYRTAAQFVAARLGIGAAAYEPPLLENEANADRRLVRRRSGGLTVVGSYVPKTTDQLARLLEQTDLERVELDVETLLDATRREPALASALARTNDALRAGRDVIVFTSRRLITGTDAARSLDIGRRVSDALVVLVQRLDVRPRYLIAKGGITSSDLATRGLGVKRALVLGQLLPGIPVWRLGAEAKFPGLDYVVFPGNVGGPDALSEAVNHLSKQP
jgi:uncharacterized protein YgbK (DUF1537 family)